MTLFESFTTPNDREWMQIRDGLQSKMKTTMKAITRANARWKAGVVATNTPWRKQVEQLETELKHLQDDLQKHIALRTKYETAGKAQLSLF